MHTAIGAAICFLSVFAMAVQIITLSYAIDRLLDGDADREDVALLIPGVWVLIFIWYCAKEIPGALRRKP